MTTMPKFKTDTPTTTTDTAFIGGCAIRLFGDLRCPRCRAQLRTSAMRDIGDGEYTLTCQRCHADAITITDR